MTGDDNSRVIDPTENVKEALAGAVKRLDDLRDLERYWQDKLDQVRDRAEAQVARANEKAAVAEKDRLDAQRAEDKAAIALALARGEVEAKTLVGQVDTTAKALAATSGRDIQRTEGRQDNRWLIGLVMGVPAFLLALAAVVLLLTR